MKCALLMLDFLNEIIHKDGKFGELGYADEAKEKNIIKNAERILNFSREINIPIIHVKVGFDNNYITCPTGSEVFKMVRDNSILNFDTWSTEIVKELKPKEGELVVNKNRVNPFYQTNLSLILRKLNVDTLILCGVSTEFVVLATALNAHDEDYDVIVLEDAVCSICKEKDASALNIITSTAKVYNVDELIFKLS
ncbi:cysteine hydrolase family protein [Vibrio spartinae]|uniref:Peroxyureidoacrylate/ureidoacrylate amidohydrolase RutB n=1 Tax=Vibrio spartinae TaxID=1918945 RepID=A0A1N6MBU3_9VIBR|nr:isochorismatase family cysteine hydrolase [Vibrio spartinae]SIO96884.1 Peroxyureidoacrylate/ureidoacrylate amidohydrolase RutB [Vibrio spartinae]